MIRSILVNALKVSLAYHLLYIKREVKRLGKNRNKLQYYIYPYYFTEKQYRFRPIFVILITNTFYSYEKYETHLRPLFYFHVLYSKRTGDS